MEPYFTGYFGNPSTLYLLGRQAKEATENARKQVASLIGASQMKFTSPAVMIGFLRGNRFNIYTNPQRISIE